MRSSPPSPFHHSFRLIGAFETKFLWKPKRCACSERHSRDPFQRGFPERGFTAGTCPCLISRLHSIRHLHFLLPPDVAEPPRIRQEVDLERGALKSPPPREHRLLLVWKELQSPRHSVSDEFRHTISDELPDYESAKAIMIMLLFDSDCMS
jgi:hypothetical protein